MLKNAQPGHAAHRAEHVAITIDAARAAQREWAAQPVEQRLALLRTFRAEMAGDGEALAATVATEHPGSLHRSIADTLVAEVLPLADACRFLEREAAWLLRPREEPRRLRPFWHRGVSVETQRAPRGVVLIIAPGNYPLLLPGVQALQALAAGNAVVWKPAPSGVACAHAVRVMLLASGLKPALLTVLDSSVDAANSAIAAGVDKVCLTGSAATGTAVLHQLAETVTPSVMELSGCDAVFVLPGADLDRVTQAVAFGLRLNGSATCMAPRRLFVAASVAKELAARLLTPLDAMPPVALPDRVYAQLRALVSEAEAEGARVLLDGFAASSHAPRAASPRSVGPTVLANVSPAMRIAQSDVFAPVLSVMPFQAMEEAVAMHAECPYMLTASIFGPDRDAQTLAAHLAAGTVILNDVIVPTADPRVSFGGRGRSGFGVTRGAEGLLAMTAPRTLVRQRGRSKLAYQPTQEEHVPLFAGYLQAAHGRGLRARLDGLRAMGRALPRLRGVTELPSQPHTRA